jgi:hypothetical protein
LLLPDSDRWLAPAWVGVTTRRHDCDRACHARLLRLAQVRAPGRRVWALEGTGCYGAGLTRFLVDQGEWVVEIDRPKRAPGRHGAKSNVLDAIRAGREALARDHLTTPRQRGHREALRVLHTTRAAIVAAGADARQLKALIITAPNRCGTGCGGGPGANSSGPAPSWWPCLVIRWSTAPPCACWP